MREQQVLDFLVSRYGAFVLLQPPLEWQTLLLWGLPPAALITGMMALLMMARRRNTASSGAEALNQEEERRLSTLVNSTAPDP
jgi:cytochrome c-type biogenesis protein CcmH